MRTAFPVGLALLALLAPGCGEDEPAITGAPATTGSTDAGRPAPASADVCELLTEAEVAEQVGSEAKPERKRERTLDGFPYSQCVWSAGKRELAVALVSSSERYEMHVRLKRGEPVHDLGDGALVEPGTSLEDRGGTGGRTAFVRVDDRTLIVALDLGGRVRANLATGKVRREDSVTVDRVAALARQALRRLG